MGCDTFWHRNALILLPRIGRLHSIHSTRSSFGPQETSKMCRRVVLFAVLAVLAVGSFTSPVSAAPASHNDSHPSLQRGSTGVFVQELQRRLNAWGGSARLPITGTYGPGTEAAVKAFQRA